MTKPRRRSYDEGCIAAHALDLIGDRWALLVARELMLGPRRFSELRTGLPGIAANVLTQRLEEMAAAGLVLRLDRLYELTAAGQGLWPILKALCLWGAIQPGHDPGLFISPAALMLSMRATCARTATHRAGFVLEGEPFTVETSPGSYHLQRGLPEGAMIFEGGTNAMAVTVYGPMPLTSNSSGLIRFTGDPDKGQAFLNLFSLSAAA